MRISDWSSDVCSSYLFTAGGFCLARRTKVLPWNCGSSASRWTPAAASRTGRVRLFPVSPAQFPRPGARRASRPLRSLLVNRSEEGRGGKEGVITGNVRGAHEYIKKTQHKN